MPRGIAIAYRFPQQVQLHFSPISVHVLTSYGTESDPSRHPIFNYLKCPFDEGCFDPVCLMPSSHVHKRYVRPTYMDKSARLMHTKDRIQLPYPEYY